MPPIEVGPARAIGAIDARLARAAGGETRPDAAAGLRGVPRDGVAAASRTGAMAGPAVETSGALDPGQAPVDAERVELIRKAVEAGTYPVVPARIADAMIAAGALLRSPKP